MARQAIAEFYALPHSPHLMKTDCGYTLMALRGLSKEISTRYIERITINGVDHEFKPLGDHTVMLIPSFIQEAQSLRIFCKDEASD